MITNKATNEFILALDEERYFEAHEVLEELWFHKRFEQSNEIKLLKGFINAAVSFELIKRGRLLASQNVWKNYLKYRQLIFKLDSKQQNIYYQISLHIERKRKTLF